MEPGQTLLSVCLPSFPSSFPSLPQEPRAPRMTQGQAAPQALGCPPVQASRALCLGDAIQA